jgi:hypothetical protein
MPKLSKIILDDHVVALNDLLLSCRRSASHLARAASILEDQDKVFKITCRRQRKACDYLETILRSMHYLPKEPDPDREAVAALATRAETLLSRNERASLLRKAAHHQSEVDKNLDRVRKLDWPSGVRGMIDDVGRQLSSMDNESSGGPQAS